MTELFQYFARCNRVVNEAMIAAIQSGGKGAYGRPMDGYFKSMAGVLEHVYVSDLNWLKRFKEIGPYSIAQDPIFEAIPASDQRIFGDLDAYAAQRAKVDALFMKLTEEAKEADLAKIFERVNRKGEAQRLVFWRALLHVFHHHAHHRGQVSQMLDELGIENNYSILLNIP